MNILVYIFILLNKVKQTNSLFVVDRYRKNGIKSNKIPFLYHYLIKFLEFVTNALINNQSIIC